MSRVTSGENKVTQHFSKSHKGIDIGYSSKEENNKVLAHSNGKVVWIQTGQKNNPGSTGNKSYGNAVKIKHDNGYYTLYAHLKNVNVKKGDYVTQGKILGVIGNTGNSYGRHLHWEVRNKLDARIDPEPYLYSNLPGLSGVYTYQTWDCKKKKWLSNVKTNTNDYAGNKGNPVGAVYIDKFEIRAHEGNRWLPWVKNRKDFAGNKKPINGFEIKGALARVYSKKYGWSKWATVTLIDSEISAIQIKTN